MKRPLPSYSGDEPYVFVSYSHADLDIVYPEICWLQDSGFNVWWDEGISPGAAWRNELADALRGCSLIVYLVTPNSVSSSQCVREINFGLDEYQRPVLAVHLLETKLPDALGLSLIDRQAILKHELPSEDYVRKLSKAIALSLAQPIPLTATLTPEIKRTYWRRHYTGYLAVGLLTMVITAGVTLSFKSDHQGQNLSFQTQFGLAMPSGVRLPDSSEMYFDITSDGQHLFFVGEFVGGRSQLYVRHLSNLETTRVPGIDPIRGEVLRSVYVSPDGSQLLLFYRLSRGGVIKRLAADGGVPVTLVETEDRGFMRLHWGDTNRIFYRTDGVIWESSSDFSTKKALVKTNAEYNTVSHPFFDKRTNTLLYVRADISNGELNKATIIEALSLETGKSSVLLEGAWPNVTTSGTLVFGRGNAVWAIPLNHEGTAVVGDPVIASLTPNFRNFGQGFAVSATGTMVSEPLSDDKTNELIWIQRDGATRSIELPPQRIFQAMVSPNEQMIAYTAGTAGTDLWIYSLADGLQSRGTYSDSWAFTPRWAPDNQTIAFTSWKTGEANIHQVNLSRRSEQPVYSEHYAIPSSWTADQQSILFERCTGVLVNCDLGILAVQSPDSAAVFFGEAAFNERFPVLSPGEAFLAYLTDEFGTDRIVIRPYPDLDAQFWQIPLDGCVNFKWIMTNEIIAECQRRIYSIPIEIVQGDLSIGRAQSLFELAPEMKFADAVADGTRFLSIIERSDSKNQLIVEVNWLDAVEKLLAKKSSPQ